MMQGHGGVVDSLDEAKAAFRAAGGHGERPLRIGHSRHKVALLHVPPRRGAFEPRQTSQKRRWGSLQARSPIASTRPSRRSGAGGGCGRQAIPLLRR